MTIIIVILLVRKLSLRSFQQHPQFGCGGAGSNQSYSKTQVFNCSDVVKCYLETLLGFSLILSTQTCRIRNFKDGAQQPFQLWWGMLRTLENHSGIISRFHDDESKWLKWLKLTGWVISFRGRVPSAGVLFICKEQSEKVQYRVFQLHCHQHFLMLCFRHKAQSVKSKQNDGKGPVNGSTICISIHFLVHWWVG